MIQLITSNYVKIVAVLSTEEGKSLAFILIPRLLSTAIIVVIIPTVVLMANLTHCYIEYGIAYIE